MTNVLVLAKNALTVFVNRVKLNTRWPCPECHRLSASDQLKQIKQELEDGTIQYSGCFYCNLDDVVSMAVTALDRLREVEE